MTDLGNNLADDRSELLRDQARARAVEHRRRQAERAAAKDRAAVTPDDPPEPPVAVVTVEARALSAQERSEAAELASNRRTVWLPTPIVDPVTGRRVLAYDPENCPEWLAGELAKQVAGDAEAA